MGNYWLNIAMRTPPDDIEVNDTLTQDEIEDTYNTGFGYRISGINLQRDDHDQQYIHRNHLVRGLLCTKGALCR